MQWNDSYILEAERTYSQRVEAAGFYLISRIRENISIPSRTVSLSIKNGKVKKTLGDRGSSRSKPGEFPHKDFGTLRSRIAQDHPSDSLVTRVGTNLAYGKYLEFGTAKMRSRPWLRRTLAEEREPIRQIIEHGERNTITVS